MKPPSSVSSPPTCGSRLAAGVALEGVQLRVFDTHRDTRGSFIEVFQSNWQLEIQPVQWSVVASQANVLRGLHLHRRHDEYFAVLRGRASVGLRDLRPWSPTHEKWSLYELSGDNMACVVFPEGVLHGWYFQEDSLHLQAVSESHDLYGDNDNWGCHWSDPELEIPWPCTDPLLADRAAAFPPLRNLRSIVGGWRTAH